MLSAFLNTSFGYDANVLMIGKKKKQWVTSCKLDYISGEDETYKVPIMVPGQH